MNSISEELCYMTYLVIGCNHPAHTTNPRQIAVMQPPWWNKETQEQLTDERTMVKLWIKERSKPHPGLTITALGVPLIIFQKRHWREKSFQKRGHFAHIGNEIKICSQNKCHHHLSNVCENSFGVFHSNWVIPDDHSFVWAVC